MSRAQTVSNTQQRGIDELLDAVHLEAGYQFYVARVMNVSRVVWFNLAREYVRRHPELLS